MDVQGKIAYITGGASGLGAATAESWVEKGGKVVLADLDRQQEMADALVAKLGADNALFVPTDVTSVDNTRASVAQAVDKFGTIHFNVNCAGSGMAGRVLGKDGPMDLKLFSWVINLNLIGTFNTLSTCAEVMDKNEPLTDAGEKGAIVNVASVAAFDGQIGQASYSASKGGIVGMTLPISRDLARHGVRVCTIAPGIFNTPLMQGAPDKVKDPLIEMVQFPHRLGLPEEFGQLAVHIAENTYLNGETIRLDGGIRMEPR